MNKISILTRAKRLAPSYIKKLDFFRHFDSDNLLRFLNQSYKLFRIVDILKQDTTITLDTNDYIDIQKGDKRTLIRIVPDWVNNDIVLWVQVDVPDTFLEVPVRLTRWQDREDIETFFTVLKNICGIDVPIVTESVELSVYINSLEDYLMSQAEELHKKGKISMGFILYRHYYLINIYLMLKRELGPIINKLNYEIGVLYLVTDKCRLSVTYSWIAVIPNYYSLDLKKIPSTKDEWKKVIRLIKTLNQ